MKTGLSNKRTESEADDALSNDPTPNKKNKIAFEEDSDNSKQPDAANTPQEEFDARKSDKDVAKQAVHPQSSKPVSETPARKADSEPPCPEILEAVERAEAYAKTVAAHLPPIVLADILHEKPKVPAKGKRNKEENLAYCSGKRYAHSGGKLASVPKLMEKSKYNDEQIQAYIDGFMSSVGATPQIQAERRAQHKQYVQDRYNREKKTVNLARMVGKNSATRGVNPKTLEEVMDTTGYSKEEAEAYLEGYQSKVGTPKEQEERRLQRLEYAMRYRKSQRNNRALNIKSKSLDSKQKNSRAAEQKALHQQGSQSNSETPAKKADQRNIDKAPSKGKQTQEEDVAYHSGRKCAFIGGTLKSKEQLMEKNNYNEEQAMAYIDGFNSRVSTSEVQAERKSKYNNSKHKDNKAGTALPKPLEINPECSRDEPKSTDDLIDPNNIINPRGSSYLNAYHSETKRSRRLGNNTDNDSIDDEKDDEEAVRQEAAAKALMRLQGVNVGNPR